MTRPHIETPTKTGMNAVGKGITFIVLGAAMFFFYTTVLPSIPVIGPFLGAGTHLPSEVVAETVLDQFDTSSANDADRLGTAGQQALDVKSDATNAAFISAAEQLYQTDLESVGYTERDFLDESYRWCASVQAYGRTGAEELAREFAIDAYGHETGVAAYKNSQPLHRLIEDYLCT